MFQRKAVQRFWHHCQLDEVPVPGPTRFPSVATFVAARPQLLVCERMAPSKVSPWLGSPAGQRWTTRPRTWLQDWCSASPAANSTRFLFSHEFSERLTWLLTRQEHLEISLGKGGICFRESNLNQTAWTKIEGHILDFRSELTGDLHCVYNFTKPNFAWKRHKTKSGWWLVVEPTLFEKYSSKWESSQSSGWKYKSKAFELPPTRNQRHQKFQIQTHSFTVQTRIHQLGSKETYKWVIIILKVGCL